MFDIIGSIAFEKKQQLYIDLRAHFLLIYQQHNIHSFVQVYRSNQNIELTNYFHQICLFSLTVQQIFTWFLFLNSRTCSFFLQQLFSFRNNVIVINFKRNFLPSIFIFTGMPQSLLLKPFQPMYNKRTSCKVCFFLLKCHNRSFSNSNKNKCISIVGFHCCSGWKFSMKLTAMGSAVYCVLDNHYQNCFPQILPVCKFAVQ